MQKVVARVSATALGLVALLALSSCSSSSSNSGGGGGSGSSGATTGATTGSTAGAASGTAIDIGMINQENTAAGSFPEMRESLQASFDYINKELGGVNGHPLKLTACATDASPASSTTCARQMVSDKVVAVAAGVDFGSSGSLPVLESAKIPYVGGEPILPPELTNPDSWSFVGGSVGAFPGQAYYIAKVLKAKKVAILTTANPAGEAAATTYGKNVLNNLGVSDVKIVTAAADAADFTAPVQQVAADKPDVVMVLFSSQGCSRIMQAKSSLGVTSQFFYAGSCADAGVVKAGGSGAEGAYFNSELMGYNSDDPQVTIYRNAMKTYSPKTVISGFGQNGFETGMNLYALLKKLPEGGITSAALITALGATSNEPNFMGHPYTCDRKQIPGLPAICQAYERILQYKGGSFVDQGQWVNGAVYVKSS